MIETRQLIVTPGYGIIIPSKGTQKFNFFGRVYYEHIRKGKILTAKWVPNGITNIGKDTILNTMFNSATQISQASWCIGQISAASFTAVSATDTMASHSGWIEFTGYSEATRVAWGPSNSSGQNVTNATAATFDITASSGTLQGVFLCSQNTISGTTGILWTTALYASPIPIAAGDQIKIIYAVAC